MKSFYYNIFGELIEAAMGNDTYINDYDPIGNRTFSVHQCPSVVTNTYTANNLNQYTSVSSVPSVVNPAHDSDGNITWNGRQAFTGMEKIVY